MIITLSELQALEIIAVEDGRKLGHVQDLEIDPSNGRIIALVLLAQTGGGLFKKHDEFLIGWEQIMTIGSDVILAKTTE